MHGQKNIKILHYLVYVVAMEGELKVKWRVGECLSGETKVLGGRSVPMPLRPPQIAETTVRHTQIEFACFRCNAQ